jgi:hypothetical protein
VDVVREIPERERRWVAQEEELPGQGDSAAFGNGDLVFASIGEAYAHSSALTTSDIGAFVTSSVSYSVNKMLQY